MITAVQCCSQYCKQKNICFIRRRGTVPVSASASKKCDRKGVPPGSRRSHREFLSKAVSVVTKHPNRYRSPSRCPGTGSADRAGSPPRADVVRRRGSQTPVAPTSPPAAAPTRSFQRFSATQTLSSAACRRSATRYFGNASADCGPACGSRTENAPVLQLHGLVDGQRTQHLLPRDRHPPHRRPHHQRRWQRWRAGHHGRAGCTPSGGTAASWCLHGRPIRRHNTSGSSQRRQREPDQHVERLRRAWDRRVNHSVQFTWSQTARSRRRPASSRSTWTTRRCGSAPQPRRLATAPPTIRHRRPHAVERRSTSSR